MLSELQKALLCYLGVALPYVVIKDGKEKTVYRFTSGKQILRDKIAKQRAKARKADREDRVAKLATYYATQYKPEQNGSGFKDDCESPFDSPNCPVDINWNAWSKAVSMFAVSINPERDISEE